MQEGEITETKTFIAIALYLQLVLNLFEIRRFTVLREVTRNSVPGDRIGFTAVNALILGKVILIGQALRVGHQFSKETPHPLGALVSARSEPNGRSILERCPI